MIQLENIKGNFKRDKALNAEHPIRVLIVKEASGLLCMNSGDYVLSPGRVFFIPEEGIIRLEGEVISAYWLSFSSLLYSEFLLQHRDVQSRNLFMALSFKDLNSMQAQKAFSLLEQLKREIIAKRDISYLAQYLSLLLGFSAVLNAELMDLSVDELQQVLRFRAILEQYFKIERSTEFYASGMGMSSRKLNSFLKKAFAKNLPDLLFARLIREAEELLIHTDYSMSMIAEILGFEQANSFTSSFKRSKGVSAVEFRKIN
ncbi:AraC family transcriptional regulator [Pedobacter jamesrossensis]|uniref:Helix-turn-helix domain-containing protein n=1 Tax=Pedobacter jamesrossensis TaxID=1908238 RepID=A0ABV8NMY3_9SPHI